MPTGRIGDAVISSCVSADVRLPHGTVGTVGTLVPARHAHLHTWLQLEKDALLPRRNCNGDITDAADYSTSLSYKTDAIYTRDVRFCYSEWLSARINWIQEVHVASRPGPFSSVFSTNPSPRAESDVLFVACRIVFGPVRFSRTF